MKKVVSAGVIVGVVMGVVAAVFVLITKWRFLGDYQFIAMPQAFLGATIFFGLFGTFMTAKGVPEGQVHRLRRARKRAQIALTGVIAILVVGLASCSDPPTAADDPRADPHDAAKVALGEQVHLQHCARCHGIRLEGQPNWRRRLPNGRLPAPPHDDSGHTWHHADHVLFAITKNGLVPPHAPQGYASDMPAFGGTLSDEAIWSVLAYIKSRWSPAVLPTRAEMLRSAGTR